MSIKIIKKTDKGFKLSWLKDKVIASYFYCSRQCYKSLDFTQISEALSASIFGSVRSLLSDVNLGDFDYIYISYNNSGTHWVLAVVNVWASAMIILDPISINYQSSNKSHKEAVTIVSVILNKWFSKEVIET